jgi:hypothetical protein
MRFLQTCWHFSDLSMRSFSASQPPYFWRELAQFSSSIEAELLRAYLAASDIDVWIYSKRDFMLHSISATEPVSLLVREDCYDDAVRLMIELDAQAPNREIDN